MSLDHRQRVTLENDYYEPYAISQGIRAGHLLFLSGQSGIAPDGRTVPGGFEAQARQAFSNVANVLAAAGIDLSDVVKVTILVTDMSYLDTIIKLRREFFTEPYPADTLVQVAGLAQPDWMIEIEAAALIRHQA
jgi:reactive intermediate/imine deaminase